MDISTVICTYNRCKDLKDALESLEKQTGTEEIQWEVIVVDNNSSDGTKALVEEFIRTKKLALSYVLEEQQGLSYARNRGIKESKGDIVAFIDDDVIVDSHWIGTIHETYQQYEFDCMGGKALPLWESAKSSWLSKELYGYLGLLDHGNEVFSLRDSTRELYGCNFIVHKKILKKIGEFKPYLGSMGKKLFRGDETDLLRRIIEADGVVIYQPKAIVHHKVPAQRLKKWYFTRWKYYQGLGLGMTNSYEGRIKLLGVPSWMLRYFFRSVWMNIKGIITSKPQERFSCWLNLCYQFGKLVGLATSHCKASKIPLSIQSKQSKLHPDTTPGARKA